MESIRAVVTKKILNWKKILKNQEATETEFFAKGYEKCKILSDFWKQRLLIWMTTLALKFKF